MVEDLIDLKNNNIDTVENPEGIDRYMLRGPQGKSAYDLVVEKGYTGTEEEFANLLTDFQSATEEVKHAVAPIKDSALQSYTNNFSAVNNFRR